MPQPCIIALTGAPDVGKDTVASFISPQLGFARIAFADALRREVCENWRVDPRMLTERAIKETPIPALAAGMCGVPGFLRWVLDGEESLVEPRSPRWTLQQWATYQRRFDDGYYTGIVKRWLERRIGISWNRLVVTDLRHEVEADMLRSMGAKVIRVHRPDAKPLPATTAEHSSERHHQAIEADADIVNDGSLTALAEATVQCLAELGVSHA